MQLILSIIVFIFIFSLLILVHEFGHFWMARRAGVKVHEFGFGLPPRMWEKKKGDTLYSINWIPFGGFVRLYGEDPNEFRATKSKESFLTQSGWTKTKIVCGGVFMNFMLAWLLLTIGFAAGIEPLIVNFDQFERYLRAGDVHLSPYYVVQETNEDLHVRYGDQIVEVDRMPLGSVGELSEYVASSEHEGVKLTVRSINHPEGEEIDGYAPVVGSIDTVYDYTVEEFEQLELYPAIRLPRLVVSRSASLGLEAGDQILRVNGQEVLSKDDFFAYVYEGRVETIDVLRNGQVFVVKPDLAFSRTRVDRVLPDSPAGTAGVVSGDVFVTINGLDVFDPEEVKETTMRIAGQTGELTYVFLRGEEQIELEITPNESGLIGVALSPVVTTQALDIEFYETFVGGSVLRLDEQQVSVWKAPGVALKEIRDIGVVTGRMIAGVFAGVFSSGEVPDSVAGPVGIAQMTHMSVQDGFMAVLRFTAILSLSLGVLNILPFPALDGGRFAFILFEAVTGKKVAHKFEAMIHAIGFAVLLLLIVLITWNDIARLL